jgi:hypothetical protein
MASSEVRPLLSTLLTLDQRLVDTVTGRARVETLGL